jgi:hypothetical protein
MNTGLNRRTLPSRKRRDHGNAEGSSEANSSGPVETQRSADHHDGRTLGASKRTLIRPASPDFYIGGPMGDEGIVQTELKGSEHLSPHLHQCSPWIL